MKKFFSFFAVFLMIGISAVSAMGRRPAMEPETAVSAPPKIYTLEECFQLALKRSETLEIQKEEIEKTEAQFLQATGEAIGDVDFLMTDFVQDSPQNVAVDGSSVGGTLSRRERRERKFVITQPLFQGFRSLGALAGSGSLRAQREEELRRAQELLFIDVVNAYYGLIKQAKDVETIEGIQALLIERVNDLKDREKIGRSRTSEVAAAESSLKILEAQLAASRGALSIAQDILEFLAGVPIQVRQLQLEKEDETTLKLEEYLEDLEERPDVEAALQAMKTARRAVVVAQSDLWPEIDLEANQYEKREGFQSDIDWDVLFKINVPIFRGGSTIGALKESISSAKQAKWNYSLVKRQAELDIKQSYHNWIMLKRQYKSLEEAVRASQENFRLQKEEYSRSLVNNLEVLASLETFFEASRQANQIYYQMKQNFWQLQVSSGNCCSEMKG